MAQAINRSQQTKKGRGKGLLIVWRRELEKKLKINRYLPGRSRGATLAIMAQMDQHPVEGWGWIKKPIVTSTIWIVSPLGLDIDRLALGMRRPQKMANHMA